MERHQINYEITDNIKLKDNINKIYRVKNTLTHLFFYYITNYKHEKCSWKNCHSEGKSELNKL